MQSCVDSAWDSKSIDCCRSQIRILQVTEFLLIRGFFLLFLISLDRAAFGHVLASVCEAQLCLSVTHIFLSIAQVFFCWKLSVYFYFLIGIVEPLNSWTAAIFEYVNRYKCLAFSAQDFTDNFDVELQKKTCFRLACFSPRSLYFVSVCCLIVLATRT